MSPNADVTNSTYSLTYMNTLVVIKLYTLAVALAGRGYVADRCEPGDITQRSLCRCMSHDFSEHRLNLFTILEKVSLALH
jgi:hypothetical protein